MRCIVIVTFGWQSDQIWYYECFNGILVVRNKLKYTTVRCQLFYILKENNCFCFKSRDLVPVYFFSAYFLFFFSLFVDMYNVEACYGIIQVHSIFVEFLCLNVKQGNKYTRLARIWRMTVTNSQWENNAQEFTLLLTHSDLHD